MTRLVGVDPGASTGLVCVDLPLGSWNILDARPVGTRTITRPTSPKLSDAEKDLFHRLALAHQLQEWAPTDVALECPKDVSDGWGAGGRRVGTAFRLGVGYAACLFAIPPGTQIGTALVRGSTKLGKGWRGYGKKEKKLAEVAALAGHLKLDMLDTKGRLIPHLLDALGVAAFYCGQQEAR